MLCNIDQSLIKDARRILTLLCFASRPLTLRELIDGIAVEINEPKGLNKRCRLEDYNDIHNICPGFININLAAEHTSETYIEMNLWSTVQIAHFSVQEYLESDRIRHQKADIFSLSSVRAHAEIAQICLVYLLERDLSKPELDVSILKEYPLARFAAMYWYHHYQRTVDLASEVDHFISRLFQQKTSFITWVKLHDMDKGGGSIDLNRRSDNIAGPVYYISLLGLDKALYDFISIQQLESSELPAKSSSSVLEVSKLINAQGGFFHNALCAASDRGHEKTVQLLLDSGADFHPPVEWVHDALYLASGHGHDKIIRLLFDKGAEIHAQPGHFGNALQVASLRGREKTVQLLLDRGANVNAQGGFHTYALQAASFEGHKEIVQLLLDRGADVNAPGGKYGNALQAASHFGYKEVVQLLLDRGADVNAQGGHYWDVLQAASAKGHEEVAKLLLDRGADVNAQGGEYRNALIAASAHGREEVVQLLLDRGADVNTQDGRGRNALQAAVDGGHEEVADLLLDRGADVNTRRHDALQAASAGGHEEVLQRPPDNGATDPRLEMWLKMKIDPSYRTLRYFVKTRTIN